VQSLTLTAAELDDHDLTRLYAYPRPEWLRANMVASADGAGSFEGLSGGLSSAADRRLFGLLRALCDVVLVGAGTARKEGYRPARRRPGLAGLRAGRTQTPPIALVSRALDLDLGATLFTDAPPDARTIVITCAASPAGQRDEAARVADVIVAGEGAVDLELALGALRERGLGRVLCEGGPQLLGYLTGAGLLDDLCLTVSPLLAGPGATRIIAGEPFASLRLTLGHVLHDDGFLFCRYLAENPRLPGKSFGRRHPGQLNC
jgi:riboflavin biosynthesis pyrimidine reductase